MLNHRYSGSFKKERKLMQKQNRDMGKLTAVMKMIVYEQPLPPERKNHPLHGKWEGMLECHIQGDWVLIYEIDTAARKVIFHHTGRTGGNLKVALHFPQLRHLLVLRRAALLIYTASPCLNCRGVDL